MEEVLSELFNLGDVFFHVFLFEPWLQEPASLLKTIAVGKVCCDDVRRRTDVSVSERRPFSFSSHFYGAMVVGSECKGDRRVSSGWRMPQSGCGRLLTRRSWIGG